MIWLFYLRFCGIISRGVSDSDDGGEDAVIRTVKDERGMSMVIALFFMLVATMVSVVIVTAGVTTVQRVANDRTREQSRASVTSAARVTRGLLSESSVTVSWTGTEDGTGGYVWSTPVPSGNGRFGEMLSALVGNVVNNPLISAESPASREVTVSVDGDDDRLVDCQLVLEAYPTDTPDVELFDVDVTVRGRMTSADGDYVTVMPPVRMVGNVVEGVGTRRCDVAWVDDTQVRFLSGGA